MGEVREVCVDVSVPPNASLRVGGGVVDLAIAKALATKASTIALRKSRREERLILQADAAACMKLQQGRCSRMQVRNMQGRRILLLGILRVHEISIQLQLR
jgi:hypothetical protein